MLIPTKHTEPSLSILNVSGIIIEELRRSEIIDYTELYNTLIGKLGPRVREIILYSLSFLFLLGKIEYLIGIDAVRLVKNENM